jgi:hypothetical protein
MGALYHQIFVGVDMAGYGEQVTGGIGEDVIIRQVIPENFPAVIHCLINSLGLGEDGGKTNQPPEMGEINLE